MTEKTSEQRQFQRYALAEKMYCYIDGARFDARSQDISAGGLFIRTPRQVPMGAHIALVFKDSNDPDGAPVFLVGKVMRRQSEPTPGIGLRWERATTEGSAARLELFLTLRMGILPTNIQRETYGPRREVRNAFYFSGEESATPAPKGRRLGDPRPLQERTPQVREEPPFRVVEPAHVVRSDGQLEKLEPTPLPEHVVRLSDGTPGPLSCILQRGDSLAPVTLDARVSVAGTEVPAKIRGMSVKTMFLTGVEGLNAASPPFQVVFRLPARADWATITCDCRVLFVDSGDGQRPGGLEVEIDRYDEGDAKGILWTYLKWVTFRQIRGEES
jgi:Tfp pilus assembly protein PilZ